MSLAAGKPAPGGIGRAAEDAGRAPAPPRLRLEGVAKRFGKTIAVYPTDLEARPGELLVLLGPSGCGKTTTLRLVAGLEEPTQGTIRIDGRDVTSARPGERDVAYLSQDVALYPHLTVTANAAFPLRAEGLPAHEAGRRAEDVVRRLGLGHAAHLRPKALSSGERRRAALARALVRRPRLFLLDEPLAGLDGWARESLREGLKAILAEAGATTVLVTHDQEEALALADRLAVMKDGRLAQVDTPRAVYERPANLFVADFVGSPGMNLLPGTRQGDTVTLQGLPLQVRVQDGEPDGTPLVRAHAPKVWLGVRPENVILTDEGGAPCVVEHTESLGSHNLLTARLEGGGALRAWLPAGVRFREGQAVGVGVLPAGCRWFDAATGDALPWRTLEAACRAT